MTLTEGNPTRALEQSVYDALNAEKPLTEIQQAELLTAAARLLDGLPRIQDEYDRKALRNLITAVFDYAYPFALPDVEMNLIAAFEAYLMIASLRSLS